MATSHGPLKSWFLLSQIKVSLVCKCVSLRLYICILLYSCFVCLNNTLDWLELKPNITQITPSHIILPFTGYLLISLIYCSCSTSIEFFHLKTHIWCYHYSKHKAYSFFKFYLTYWMSVVMLTRWGHQPRSTKSKKEGRRDEESKQTLVECLSSLTGKCKWSRLSVRHSCREGGNSSVESIQVWAQLHPHHSCIASDPPGKH